ncbi:hypothetical protein DPMN_100693 [Dreissena polymorpha]|uniref:Uncharacterized protein n=1 Tax=Dreissena polymorpha TaxID=45954 RepID=A0A9D4R7N5_DREPO|nr:hypothetical protein DPMN_100693 [Dreissena polymorpha]
MMVALCCIDDHVEGDSNNALAESYVDSEKGITDKRQWGSMTTKTVNITKDNTHRRR